MISPRPATCILQIATSSREAAVTADDVQRVAREYLQDNRLITTALLPAEYVAAAGLPTAEDLSRPAGLQEVAAVQLGTSEVRRTERDDGTIVLLKRVATSPLVSIQMLARGGMTAEDAQTNGLGNLTMNLAMRGTTTRSAQQIAQSLDSMGAQLATATNTNTWSWQGSCLRENLPQTLEIFSDVFKNANFPDSEIDPMKQRIYAAISSEDSIWSTQAVNFFKKTFFGPDNSPYQFNSLGTPANVKQFDRQQIVQWYKSAQTSPRVLAIYGDIDVDQTEKLLKNNFFDSPKVVKANSLTSLTNIAQATTVDDATPATIHIDRVAVQPTQQALAGVIIGFEAKPVLGDPSNFTLDVGQTLCGGYTPYPAGYLFEILRGRGLVYVVQAGQSTWNKFQFSLVPLWF